MPRIASLVVFIFLSFGALAAGPVWDKRDLDNVYERHRDWLVVNNPSGFCYMLQSYGSAAPDLIVRNDDSVNLMNVGRYQSITYQVDDGDKVTIRNPGISGTGYILLPDASIQILKPGSSLSVPAAR